MRWKFAAQCIRIRIHLYNLQFGACNQQLEIFDTFLCFCQYCEHEQLISKESNELNDATITPQSARSGGID